MNMTTVDTLYPSRRLARRDLLTRKSYIDIVFALFIFLLLGNSGQAQMSQLLDEITIEQKLDSQLPLELEFQDSEGQTVRLGDYFGERPVILQLVYFECPMLCNLNTDGLIRALKVLSLELGKDYEVVTVSFDPRERDFQARRTKDKIRSLFDDETVPIEEHWHVLTGNEATIRQLTDTVGFNFRYDEKNDRFAHSAGIVILTPAGRVARYLNGVEYAPVDVRYSVVEASQGKIGTLTDKVALLCYQYDPMKGRYGWAIMSGLRAGGLLTVLVLGGGIVWMIRRERASARQSDPTFKPAP